VSARGDALLDRTWHHSRFQDIDRLVSLKEKKGLKISLAFPTLNEEMTIGKEILVIRTELMDRYPLVDEIVVIDSSSKDNTRKVAERFGARVFSSKTILPKYGSFRGKGENLWKSLYVLEGDIIVWVDADISNIAPKFVYGLLGPLLEDDRIGYVKAFYERPIRSSSNLSPSGGGRVTEILVRPLFSLFYPELARLVQPLSGEYAGRRDLLERLPVSVGYGVELGHLIDILNMAGLEALAQVDLDMRIHRNQSTAALSKMAYGILNTFFSRAEKYGLAQPKIPGDRHIALERQAAEHLVQQTEIPTEERPPMLEIPEYREKFHR
jgi:glucosyl-3-phosphoglycerate synthase